MPATVTHSPSLRSRPAPRSEPPYDDELPGPTAAAALAAGGHVQGALALSLAAPPPPPAAPPLRLVPPLADDAAEGPASALRAGEDDGPSRTPRAGLPHPKLWAGRLALALLEVIAGERPATQVMRHVSPGIYADLTRSPRRPAPPRRARPLQVHSVHVCEPADGVAEVCAVLSRGGRRRAVAMRLEGQHGRWRCTALQVA